MLSQFLREHCHHAPGKTILFRDFCIALNRWAMPQGTYFTNKKIIAGLGELGYPFGIMYGNRRGIANLSFSMPPETIVVENGRLRIGHPKKIDTTFARNEIRRLRAACYTFAAIADRLNELGFTTATGKPWTSQTASSELRNHGG